MRFRKGSCPPGLWQGLSWIILLFVTVAFYLEFYPDHPSLPHYVVIGLNTLLTVALIVFGVLGTYVDPSDPTVFEERTAKETNTSFDDTGYTKICTICKTHVQEGSKHCCDCNTCVIGFDHHCKWLNNCIGSINYKYFAGLLGILQALSGMHTIVSIWLSFRDTTGEDLNSALLEVINHDCYLVLVFVAGSLSFAIFVANGHLIGFHLWLAKEKMTTYDFILKRRELKKRMSKKSNKVISSSKGDGQLTFRDHGLPGLNIKSTRSITTSSHIISTRRKDGWESDRLCTDHNTHMTDDPSSEPKNQSPADEE
mmetsp:Transcript_32702/g.56895  ORF Transcript_32702/g.56895 Transcript_32702/m.56895 type:complete len:311 (+) Transcript_32702:3368-4300(+)